MRKNHFEIYWNLLFWFQKNIKPAIKTKFNLFTLNFLISFVIWEKITLKYTEIYYFGLNLMSIFLLSFCICNYKINNTTVGNDYNDIFWYINEVCKQKIKFTCTLICKLKTNFCIWWCDCFVNLENVHVLIFFLYLLTYDLLKV